MSAPNQPCKTSFVTTLDLSSVFYGRIAIALSLAVLLGTAPLRGQKVADAAAPISTDRPSVANSSVVVPEGGFQLENGLLITSTQGQHVLDLPETLLRFGLLNKTEVRLSVPNYFYDLPTSTSATSGFGDIALGVKQQFGPLHRNFDLSLIVFLSLPTGAQAVSSHGYDPGLQVPWTYKLSENWTAGGQVASYWPTLAAKHTFTGESTVLLDRQLTQRWDTFVEYAGDFPRRGGSRQLGHFGTAFRLKPRHQLDFHVGVGLSGGAPEAFVGFGYSILLRPVE